MAKKLIVTIIALIGIIAMVVPGCGGDGDGITPEPRTTGPFLDAVFISSVSDSAAAVYQLKNDEVDVYAFGMADAALFQDVVADPNLTSVSSLGSYNEFTFNCAGPVFDGTGKLNPFAVKEFREAMHWVVDRDYLVGEILGGLGSPRYCGISTAGVDGNVRFPDLVAELEAKYAHDPDKAETVVNSVMTDLGATKEDAKWMYNGEPVEIIVLIRVEDERKEMGDYFATLLEDLGFTATRTYGQSGVLSPMWTGDPDRGVFHVYTGGWVSTVIPLDEGDNFGFFYTTLGAMYMGPLWETYETDPVFYEAAERLWNYDYASTEERGEFLETCLRGSMEYNFRMFVCDRASYFPMRADVRLASDAYGGVYGSWMWAQTAHFVDEEGEPIVGGTMRIATTDILTNPWNPIAGTNWVYDMFPIRATRDVGTQPDTRTGLRWNGRIEKAELFVKQGQPVEVTNTEWCTLKFVPEVEVPLDAWADWDAETQTFITVEDKFGSAGTTSVTKSVAYYPKDIFELKLHDGSELSMGDFILYTILLFDRGDPKSGIYDESYVSGYDAFMSVFKGVKFITDDPDYGLIVEYYTDLCQLNAELTVDTMWPDYAQGPGFWHTVTLGIMAEEDGELAFSQSKSDRLGVEWTSFISGPSISILKDKLDIAQASDYVPYEPTMGEYVSGVNAFERWNSLSSWFNEKNHFWVASGPFYLESAYTTEDVIHLKRFEDYPDPMDRWLFLLEPIS